MTAILPLMFVLTLSMSREGYEDYNRYESDKGKFPHNPSFIMLHIHIFYLSLPNINMLSISFFDF